MKRVLVLLCLATLGACSSVKKKEVSTSSFTYSDGETQMNGFIAVPKAIEGKVPGVLVVHEWWGQTEYPRIRAKQLAELGYVAMAVDMYGGGKIAKHPKDAGKFSSKTMKDLPSAKRKFKAAMKELMNNPNVDKNKISAIGYCFGGAVVLSMARSGVDLDAVVSFHGSLPNNKFDASRVRSNILVINGEADSFIKEERIKQFNEQMQAIDTEYKFVNLKGALHGFTNPGATLKGKKFGIPLKYDAEADSKSWKLMQKFFNKHM